MCLWCSEPSRTAKALHGLFDISTGTRSITVVGNSGCSIIAAVAYLIFDLNVRVEGLDGGGLFASSNVSGSSSVQVNGKYVATQTSGVVIADSTYVLHEAKDILTYTLQNRRLLLRRRLPWKHCLRSMFGSMFVDLIERPAVLGKVFGSVAHICQALEEGEIDVQNQDRQAFIDFTEASFGVGFIDSVGEIFPELSSLELRPHMDLALGKSPKKAEEQFEDPFVSMKRNWSYVDCTDVGGPLHNNFRVC